MPRRSPEAEAWHILYRDPRWKRLRQLHLAEHPWCERHLARGQKVEATVAHHVTPHKGDEQRFFDPSNLSSLCKPCHDGPAQQIEKRGYSTEVDNFGVPVDPNHPFMKPIFTNGRARKDPLGNRGVS